MAERRVDQILAGIADGDAISQDAVAIRDVLQGLGFASEIYAARERTDARASSFGEDRPYGRLDAGVAPACDESLQKE